MYVYVCRSKSQLCTYWHKNPKLKVECSSPFKAAKRACLKMFAANQELVQTEKSQQPKFVESEQFSVAAGAAWLSDEALLIFFATVKWYSWLRGARCHHNTESLVLVSAGILDNTREFLWLPSFLVPEVCARDTWNAPSPFKHFMFATTWRNSFCHVSIR